MNYPPGENHERSYKLFRAFSSPDEKRIVLPAGMTVRIFSLRNPSLAGESILFFTDPHIRLGCVKNFFSASGTPKEWRGTQWIEKALLEAIKEFSPEYLLFGGDLVAYMNAYPDAVGMLSHLHAEKGKFAVFGNWDKKRRSWFPFHVTERMYAEAGWRILCNESAEPEDGLKIYGLDDAKIGIPNFYGSGDRSGFSILMSHNPDAAVSLPPDQLAHFQLILCGHTHGGQLRIPGFGAIKASSKHWKRFEYGTYRNTETGTEMIVSSGIGATCFPFRFNCPPEIIVLRFT